MVHNSTKVICDECHYETPNDYYFGVKTWIFCDRKEIETGEIEEVHFCGKDCYDYHKQMGEESGEYELIGYKEVKCDSEEFRKLYNKARNINYLMDFKNFIDKHKEVNPTKEECLQILYKFSNNYQHIKTLQNEDLMIISDLLSLCGKYINI